MQLIIKIRLDSFHVQLFLNSSWTATINSLVSTQLSRRLAILTNSVSVRSTTTTTTVHSTTSLLLVLVS